MREDSAAIPKVEIRASPLGLYNTVVLGIAALVGAIGIAGGIAAHSPWVALGVVGYVGAGWGVIRRRALRVAASTETLFVRNWLGSLSLPRSAIREFRIASPSRSEALRHNLAYAPSVIAVREDGSVVWLNVTASKLGPTMVAKKLELLQHWLTAGHG